MLWEKNFFHKTVTILFCEKFRNPKARTLRKLSDWDTRSECEIWERKVAEMRVPSSKRLSKAQSFRHWCDWDASALSAQTKEAKQRSAKSDVALQLRFERGRWAPRERTYHQHDGASAANVIASDYCNIEYLFVQLWQGKLTVHFHLIPFLGCFSA